MNVILDSNILISNFRMFGPHFTLFKWFIHNQEAKLKIPLIVIEEVKNKFKENAHIKYKSTLSILGSLGSHLDIVFSEPLTNKELETLCEEYDQFLDNELQSLKTEIIPYKDIPHTKLTKRDLARKKPFRQVGKEKHSTGYRDALIWESIIRHVIPNSKATIFVTNNKKDFCEKDSATLHSQLRADLESVGFNTAQFSIRINIQDFIEKHVKPLLPDLSSEKHASLTEYFISRKTDIEKLLMDYFVKHKGALSKQLEKNLDLPFDLGWSETDMLTIREIGKIENLSVFSARELTDDLIFVEFEFESYFEFEFYAHGYYSDIDGYLPNSISVEEYEEDTFGAWLVASTILPLGGSLTLNIVNNTIQDIEGSFPEIFGFCHKCGKPIISDTAESCENCGHNFI